MSETADRRDPDFDLRTAKPDPRWLASDVIPARADPDTMVRIFENTAERLLQQFKSQYPDETMELFVLLVHREGGYRVVVGFGFSHNPLEE